MTTLTLQLTSPTHYLLLPPSSLYPPHPPSFLCSTSTKAITPITRSNQICHLMTHGFMEKNLPVWTLDFTRFKDSTRYRRFPLMVSDSIAGRWKEVSFLASVMEMWEKILHVCQLHLLEYSMIGQSNQLIFQKTFVDS